MIWDHWYSGARAFAGGSLPAEQQLSNTRALTEALVSAGDARRLGELFTIHRVKPKFSALRGELQPFWERAALPFLSRRADADSVDALAALSPDALLRALLKGSQPGSAHRRTLFHAAVKAVPDLPLRLAEEALEADLIEEALARDGGAAVRVLRARVSAGRLPADAVTQALVSLQAAPPGASDAELALLVRDLGCPQAAVDALLRRSVDSEPLLRLAEPETLGAFSERFAPETWTDVIVPRLSADATAEGVNLLRDACHYSPPHPGLYRAIVAAMRAGYIETESFPLMASQCLRRLPQGDCEALLAETLRLPLSHKMTRAVTEIVLRLLGLFELSDEPMELDRPERLVRALARVPALPAYRMWTAVLLAHPDDFAPPLPELLPTVQTTMQGLVRDARSPEAAEAAEALWALLAALAVRVPVEAAPALFDLTMQLLTLLPHGQEAVSDDLLAFVVGRVTGPELLNDMAVAQALHRCGELTRTALAGLVPHLCLDDASAAVRVTAMRALQPAHIAAHAEAVLQACSLSGAEFYALDVAHAAAPLLATLALQVPELLRDCVNKLVAAVPVSRESDTLVRPDPELARALSLIASRGALDEVRRYAASPQGLAALPTLVRWCPEWMAVANALIADGEIAERVPGRFSHVTSRAASSPLVEEAKEGVDAVAEALERGLPLLALRRSADVRTRFPHAAPQMERCARLVAEQVLPAVAAQCLPRPEWGANDGLPRFSHKQMANYDAYVATLDTVAACCPPHEAEGVLHVTQRRHDLDAARVREFLDADDARGARQWLKRSGKASQPRLIALVEAHEAPRLFATPVVPMATAVAEPVPEPEGLAYPVLPDRQIAPRGNSDVWLEMQALGPNELELAMPSAPVVPPLPSPAYAPRAGAAAAAAEREPLLG